VQLVRGLQPVWMKGRVVGRGVAKRQGRVEEGMEGQSALENPRE
jgi:hypothetical protein